MLYWMESGGSGPLDGLGDMTKTDILRGIIGEKLSTAAREILAVVERTVADYEREASGFRLEIERQRRHLELLQPQIKVERRATAPSADSRGAVQSGQREDGGQTGDGRQREDGGQTGDGQTGGGASGSLGLPCCHDDDDAADYGENDEEEQLLVDMAASAKQKREDLKDPDYQISSRSFLPRVRSYRKKLHRPAARAARGQLDFRIRILQDCRTDVLSNTVFQKYPLHELQCPRGLQEADFLDLLRSTFPQLAADGPFDFFITDRRRRLQPLQVQALTPEEIHRTIRTSGNSALYIRLQTAEDHQSSSDDPDPAQEPEADGSAHQTEASPSRSQERPPPPDPAARCPLRICVLEDCHTDTLSDPVSSTVQDLNCPPGLQQPAFLDLLSSSFPLLAEGHRRFDIFTSDESRRLQRLQVKSLTPEEIHGALRASGARAGTGAGAEVIYIRLQTGEEAELRGAQRVISCSPVQHMASSSSSQQQDEPPEDGAAEDVSSDGDWSPDSELQSGKQPKSGPTVMKRRKQGCKVCEVWYRTRGSLIKHSWTHVDEAQSVCGVCGRGFQAAEDLKEHLRKYKKTHACSYCGKSFLTVSGLQSHTSTHTGDRPFKCSDCNKTFARMSSLAAHRWVHMPEKPHRCDVCLRTFGLMAQLRTHSQVHAARDRYHCGVCGKTVGDRRSLTHHKLTHTVERRFCCEVCGKGFKLPSTLKAHEKIHAARDRLYLCHVCSKSFFSNNTLNAHMRTHGTERPFTCSVCSKGFVCNGDLKKHMRMHTNEAPYGCSECGRFFKQKSHLNSHIRGHMGIKQFACGICGKTCTRQEHLKVHMRTHNGERPYKCSLCEGSFTQSHCLKTHMKSHKASEPPTS